MLFKIQIEKCLKKLRRVVRRELKLLEELDMLSIVLFISFIDGEIDNSICNIYIGQDIKKYEVVSIFLLL